MNPPAGILLAGQGFQTAQETDRLCVVHQHSLKISGNVTVAAVVFPSWIRKFWLGTISSQLWTIHGVG